MSEWILVVGLDIKGVKPNISCFFFNVDVKCKMLNFDMFYEQKLI